ncbi:helix-turn-helix domain-containing protein [Pirellulaceae bacterium SH501]
MNEKLTDFENKLISRLKAADERLAKADSVEGLSPELTMRRVKLQLEPRSVTANEVKAIRNMFSASQSVFAALIQVPKRTLEKWEQGISEVPGPVAVLLGDMLANPGHWEKQFHRLMRGSGSRRNGRSATT